LLTQINYCPFTVVKMIDSYALTAYIAAFTASV